MTLGNLIGRDARLIVRCLSPNCGVETALEPVMIARRGGLEQTLDRVRQRLVCMGCGGKSIELAVEVGPRDGREPRARLSIIRAE